MKTTSILRFFSLGYLCIERCSGVPTDSGSNNPAVLDLKPNKPHDPPNKTRPEGGPTHPPYLPELTRDIVKRSGEQSSSASSASSPTRTAEPDFNGVWVDHSPVQDVVPDREPYYMITLGLCQALDWSLQVGSEMWQNNYHQNLYQRLNRDEYIMYWSWYNWYHTPWPLVDGIPLQRPVMGQDHSLRSHIRDMLTPEPTEYTRLGAPLRSPPRRYTGIFVYQTSSSLYGLWYRVVRRGDPNLHPMYGGAAPRDPDQHNTTLEGAPFKDQRLPPPLPPPGPGLANAPVTNSQQGPDKDTKVETLKVKSPMPRDLKHAISFYSKVYALIYLLLCFVLA